ncbi:MAG: hypothetical protein ACTSVO_14075 [Candidatus Heimdallarchaeaceae archaeon]
MIAEEKKKEEVEEQNINQESVNKLRRLRNILLLGTIIVVWTVSAVFSIIDLNKGLGILETPWVLLGIFLTLAVIIIIIVPLFRNLRTDVREALAEKEKQKLKENQETEE